MKRITIVLTIFVIILTSGCTTAGPTKDQLISADFGPPVTHEFMVSAVKERMSRILIDPNSAIYECDIPRKSWLVGDGSGNVQFNETYYGYLSTCAINSKNRLGGYAGRKVNYFMVVQRNGKPVLAHFERFLRGGPVNF